MLSSFTLISLIGVMLGVLVLVVVMAGYAGLERAVKDRFLGFSPHVQLSHLPEAHGVSPALLDWREVATKAKTLPHVKSATAFVADNVILDVNDWQNPVSFLGVDGSDPEQIDGISKMMDLKNHPESSADFGMEDRIVISSRVAESYMIGVGDSVRLYSTKNFKEVMRVYKANDKPPLREAFPEAWAGTKKLDGAWKTENGKTSITRDALISIHDPLFALWDENLREPERALLKDLLDAFEAGTKDEEAGVYYFDAETKSKIAESIDALNHTDRDKMNAESYKGLEKFVLPKDATVIGVYQASMMAVTPDLFVPLHLAQDLAGLEDGAVQSISLRLDDAYTAPAVANETRKTLGSDWLALPWNEQEQFVNFSMLLSQQRVMLSFTLSFIMLVAAFSMMANIFTVTIHKRREIGVMKALGAAPGQILRVFIYQGMLLGLLGGGLGILFGRIIIHYRGWIQEVLRSMGADPFSARITGYDVIPAHNDPVEQILIGVMAFILCTLAALVPAFIAARSDAAKSLRNL